MLATAALQSNANMFLNYQIRGSQIEIIDIKLLVLLKDLGSAGQGLVHHESHVISKSVIWSIPVVERQDDHRARSRPAAGCLQLRYGLLRSMESQSWS